MMIDFEMYFCIYCSENGLDIKLSFDMPEGYETAYGTFDQAVDTLYINAKLIQSLSDHEQLFYLYHELRHASQHLHPVQFSELINISKNYVIMFNGVCCKLVNNNWKKCKLEGSTEHFSEIYLGQPYEIDANKFAYEQVKGLLGDLRELRELYLFWLPKQPVDDAVYMDLYHMIDRSLHML